MEIKGYTLRLKDQKKIIKSFEEIINRGMISEGKYSEKLSEKLKNFTKSKYVIPVSSGSTALNIIFRYINNKYKNKVIGIPTNTFYATYRMAEVAGLKPVLLPCKELLLDFELTKKILIKKNIKNLCIVHNGGFVDEKFDEFLIWCNKKNICLIEDCAHSIGSTYNNTHTGNFGIAGAFSFFSTKTIAAGEGGFITTNNSDVASFSTTYKNYGKKEKWKSFHEFEGENFRINEFSAIVAYYQVLNIKKIINERKFLAKEYNKIIPKDLRYNLSKKMNSCSWYKYPIYTNITKELKKFNIGLSGGIYDLTLGQQPIINKIVKDQTYKHFCLPLYQGMTIKEIDHILNSLRKIFR